MSSTEVIGYDENGRRIEGAEVSIQNSWRGGPAVWSHLEKEYLPQWYPEWAEGQFDAVDDFEQLHGYRPSRMGSGDEGAMREVWNLFSDENVPRWQRIVLGTTFDYAVVRATEVPEVSEAMRGFPLENGSLGEQADAMEKLVADYGAAFIVWNQSSIVCDMWYEEDDDENPVSYDMGTGDKHWFVLDELGTGE